MDKKFAFAAACALALAWCGTKSAPTSDGTGGWTTKTAPGEMSGKYADGTYKANGPFMSPIGMDGIVVWVTLANGDGTIAGLSIQPVADTLSMNAEWIDRFSVDINKVVGKKISEIENLGWTSGSTLTYKWFLTAVSEIRSQAAVE